MRKHLGWEAWEVEVNQELELSSTIASGAKAYDPGDGVDRRHHTETSYALQVDAKHTTKGSYSVNRKFMRESLERSREAGQCFALPIRFAPASVGMGETEDWVVIPFDDFVGLVKHYRELEEQNG